jgi:hypothetical protein
LAGARLCAGLAVAALVLGGRGETEVKLTAVLVAGVTFLIAARCPACLRYRHLGALNTLPSGPIREIPSLSANC